MSTNDHQTTVLNDMHERGRKGGSLLALCLSRARTGNLKLIYSYLLLIGMINVVHFFHPSLNHNSRTGSENTQGSIKDELNSKRLYFKNGGSKATEQNAFHTFIDRSKRIRNSDIYQITTLKDESFSLELKTNKKPYAPLNTTESFLLKFFSLNDSRPKKVSAFDKSQPQNQRQRHGKVRVAAVNFLGSDISMLEKSFDNFDVVQINANLNGSLSWEDIYPPFLTGEIDSCPLSPPYSSYSQSELFDVVVVRAPCNASDASWAKNVSRHVLLLAGAEIAVNHTKGESSPVIVLSQCRPTPNLFICSELKEHKKNAWLFHVKRKDMQDRLTFPVGSCRLSTPLNKSTQDTTSTREAYATVLHSVDTYVCGAIVLAQSLKLTRTKRDLVLLHDSLIKHKDLQALKAAGWILHEIERIQNPYAKPNSYNEWNYSKLRLWRLVQYKKIVFIDSDLLVIRNMDFLFSLPELSARSNGEPTLFNSGVMVIEPSMCTFRMIMSRVKDIVPYNGGDQGFLNEIFTWWHRAPDEINFLKAMDHSNPEIVKWKASLFRGDSPSVYAIHYLGLKPWWCYKDYDCNWLSKRQYASEEAHKQWWRVHDTLPFRLQRFCFLNEVQKKFLRWIVMLAKQNHLSGEHWNVTIKDKRLHLSKNSTDIEMND